MSGRGAGAAFTAPQVVSRGLRSSWLRALAGGAAIYALVTVAALDTQNIHLVPAVLVLGALLVPVTFVVYVFERLSVQAAVLPALAICFAVGGSIGVAAASVLEYQTLRDLGALPMLAVGLIEESVKLAVPLWLLARKRFRAPADGVLFGVAAGMGFAALETMGYGLVALIQSGGRIGAAEEVLLVRGLLSPVGHAAWTGLVCAALWRARASIGLARPWVAVIAAFAVAVALHSLWDSTDSIPARVAIGLLSGTLLAAQIRQVRRDSAAG
ncbi:MAG: PrsW family intramembrane metalloprotease [Solirubrobacteraceae bacterium]